MIAETREGLRLLEAGIIKADGDVFEERMVYVGRALGATVERITPDAIAVERPVYARNAQVALKMGALFGVIYMACIERCATVAGYEPSQIKRAVTGSGAASKTQVVKMVRLILGVELSEDAADAAAVAVCHVNRRRVRRE